MFRGGFPSEQLLADHASDEALLNPEYFSDLIGRFHSLKSSVIAVRLDRASAIALVHRSSSLPQLVFPSWQSSPSELDQATSLTVNEGSGGTEALSEPHLAQPSLRFRYVRDHECVARELVLLKRQEKMRNAASIKRRFRVHDVLAVIARHRLRREL